MCQDDKDVRDIIRERRTVRQFRREPVAKDLLAGLVDAGRLAPSAANMQPLEFVAVDDPALCAEVFPCLKWAAYIEPAGDPGPGQEPAAYIVTLVNTGVRDKMFEYDVGAAMENMIVSAWGWGIGSCWLLSIDRDRLRTILEVPDRYRIDCVLALGYPAESPAVEDLKDSHRYWKDADGRLHVPKRTLASILHLNRF